MARALLPDSHPLRVRFHEFELDELSGDLLAGDTRLAVAPTPFRLLCTLARQPGVLLSKAALLDAVWGHQFVSESVLKSAIATLRTALGDDARQPRIIETVPRRGYRFVATPSALAATQPRPTIPPENRGSAPPGALFVGRAEALAQLQRAWERASCGSRALVWVTGEPGVGKTTLIERFVSGLGDVRFARGHGVEHQGMGEPFLPVLEALSDLCRRDGEVPALLRAMAPSWLLRMPWLSTVEERDALGRELAGVGRDRMLREMGELLDCYCQRHPLLLVTEDLQWSDGSTIDLLNYVARRRGSGRLMWLASFRLAEVVAFDRPLNRLRHELRVHGLCEEIALEAFSEREVACYVAQVAPSLALDHPFVQALHDRTDGVPLFVASLLADVRANAGKTVTCVPALDPLDRLEVPVEMAEFMGQYLGRLAVGRAQRPAPPAGSKPAAGRPAR